MKMIMVGLFMIFIGYPVLVAAEDETYHPIFSPATIEKASPQNRIRMLEIERQNKEKWLKKQQVKMDEASKETQEKATKTVKERPRKIYKWRDKEGKVHYGRVPENVSAEMIEVDPPRSDKQSIHISEKRRKLREKLLRAFEKERQKKQNAREEKKQKREEREKKCKELRYELNDLKEGGVLRYELDKTGKRHYLSDGEIEKRIVEMNKAYKENCEGYY